MRVFQYHVAVPPQPRQENARSLEEWLNLLGRAGWEFVGTSPTPLYGLSSWVFKREVGPQDQG